MYNPNLIGRHEKPGSVVNLGLLSVARLGLKTSPNQFVFGSLQEIKRQSPTARYILPSETYVLVSPKRLVQRRITQANETLVREREDLKAFCNGLFNVGGYGKEELYREMAADLNVVGRIILDPASPKMSDDELAGYRKRSKVHQAFGHIFTKIDQCTDSDYGQYEKNAETKRAQIVSYAHVGMELALNLLKTYAASYGQNTSNEFTWLSEMAKTFAYLELLSAGTVNTHAMVVINTNFNPININALIMERFKQVAPLTE